MKPRVVRHERTGPPPARSPSTATNRAPAAVFEANHCRGDAQSAFDPIPRRHQPTRHNSFVAARSLPLTV
jgi:hypothetical protein